MQARASAWMIRFLDPNPPTADEIVDALDNFGLYHDFDIASRMYAEYVNRNLLGYPGSVIEQPSAYWHDIAMFNWLSWWVKVVRPIPHLEEEDVIDRLKRGEGLSGALKGATP